MTGVPVSLPINLGQFLKVAGAVGSGGDAKNLVLSGGVQVNGETEQRRGRKLLAGDVVEVSGTELRVEDRGAASDPDGTQGRECHLPEIPAGLAPPPGGVSVFAGPHTSPH